MRKWESEKHRSWRTPAEGFKGHVTLTDLCWVSQESAERVVGLWYNWIMKKNWVQDSCWTHQSACRRLRKSRWAMERWKKIH